VKGTKPKETALRFFPRASPEGRMKIKLTKTSVAQLDLPAGKSDVIHFDTEITGFGLRFRRGADGINATWVLQHKNGRETLGRYPAIKPEQARAWASREYARISLGHDPAAAREEAKRQAAETLGAALRLYLPNKKLRPRSRVEIERHLLKNAASLHPLALSKIGRRDVATCLAGVTKDSGEVQANRTRASLSAFFVWAWRQGLVESNPVQATNRHPEQSRDRVLSDNELKTLWRALPEDAYGRATKLLILTGQRRDEIGRLRWAEIDLTRGVISLPAERTKNAKPHDVPLSDTARAILEAQPRAGEFVFGERGLLSWADFKRTLDARLPVEPKWVFHDLRRTAATRMVDLGVLPHVVEAVLNHTSGHRAGVAGIYNRSLYSAEKAQALARWAAHVIALVEGRESKVTSLKRM
jgi:integrase